MANLFPIIPFVVLRSLWIFAHGTTAQPLCHVKSGYPEQNEISIKILIMMEKLLVKWAVIYDSCTLTHHWSRSSHHHWTSHGTSHGSRHGTGTTRTRTQDRSTLGCCCRGYYTCRTSLVLVWGKKKNRFNLLFLGRFDTNYLCILFISILMISRIFPIIATSYECHTTSLLSH